MIFLVISYSLWLISILGYGVTFLRFLRKPSADYDPAHLLLISLLGMAVLGTVSNLINLIIPVSPATDLCLLLIGWLLIIINRDQLGETISSSWPHKSWSLVLLSFTVIFWAAFLSRQARDLPHDSGLYHLQAIEWITHSQLPLGLANLHGRLGFNSQWFSIAAALEAPGLQGKSSFIVNALPFIMYGLAIAGALILSFVRGLRLSSAFLISSGVAWISISRDDFTRDATVGSASPDFPIALLSMASAYVLIRAFESKQYWAYYVGIGSILGIFSITIKLSSLPLLAGPLLALYWLHYRLRNRLGQIGSTPSRVSVLSLAAALFLLLPWLFRGLLISGCLAYPAPMGRIAILDWVVPATHVESERLWIMSWARQPGASPDVVLSSWNWLPAWFSKFSSAWSIRQMVVMLATGVVLWGVAGSNRCLRREIKAFSIPMLASLLGIAYWFITAPDLRFGLGFLWSTTTLFFSYGATKLLALCISDKAKILERATLVIAAVALLALARFTTVTYFEPSNQKTLYSWPEMPVVPPEKVRVEFTKEGIPVFIPVSGGQCWDHDLPCSPYLDPNLDVVVDERGQARMFRIP